MNKESRENNPIRIGDTFSLSGLLTENSKSARLAHQIWEEDINSRGGLLGRKIQPVCHDDKGDASQVANLYTQLLDKGKVDLIIGGYGANTIAVSMSLAIERKRKLIGLMPLGVNINLHYPN